MDVTTIAGIVAGFGLILVGQVLEGGHAGSLVQLSAAVIVFGGTIGATLVSYPKADFVRGMKLARLAFVEPKHDLGALAKELVEYATVARRDGVLALEGKLKDVNDPFLRRALQFVVDGVDANVTRSTLETAYETEYEENAVGAKVWESMGGYAPTIGIIGAVLGLIHVMENLNDPSKLGGGIAVAFVATVYGVSAANIVFMPFGAKIKRKLAIQRERKVLLTEGVLAIQEGVNPRVLEERLRVYTGEHGSSSEARAQAKAA